MVMLVLVAVAVMLVWSVQVLDDCPLPVPEALFAALARMEGEAVHTSTGMTTLNHQHANHTTADLHSNPHEMTRRQGWVATSD